MIFLNKKKVYQKTVDGCTYVVSKLDGTYFTELYVSDGIKYSVSACGSLKAAKKIIEEEIEFNKTVFLPN